MTDAALAEAERQENNQRYRPLHHREFVASGSLTSKLSPF